MLRRIVVRTIAVHTLTSLAVGFGAYRPAKRRSPDSRCRSPLQQPSVPIDLAMVDFPLDTRLS